MPMLEAAAGAAAGAGTSLFGYNRTNFIYDRKMRQETEYQIMEFRIRQAELWREDVRDIIGLTSVKMDTYLVVNAVQLGFCVMAFCEGRLAAGSPTWLIGAHTLSLAGAFMYLLMSVWLAMHASVTAKSYEVRLLTQLVRLPVPTWSQLEGARTYASSFEKVDPKQMFRVPFAMGTQESVLASSTANSGTNNPQPEGAPMVQPGGFVGSQPAHSLGGPAPVAGPAATKSETADLWGLERRGDHIYELDGSVRTDPDQMRHLVLVREAMQYWQSYDGFARVSMSMGTNQLVTALSYYVLGYVLLSNHAVVAAWLAIGLFMAIAASLIRLDMSLTGFEYQVSVLLVVGGPCIAAAACERWNRHTPEGIGFANLVAPVIFAIHACWLTFLLYISKVSEQKGGAMLPTGFRSVMYIDVFGWIRKHTENRRRLESGRFQPAPAAPDLISRVPGSGPAVQAIRYERGRPVPCRPEELPGASQEQRGVEVRREDFVPTTFVPREKVKEDRRNGEAAALQPFNRPGYVPWRIFSLATILLISLWCLVGISVLLQSCGAELLRVRPLLRSPGGGEGSGTEGLLQVASELEGGMSLPTSWPRGGVRPHGLACGGDGEDGPMWAVATTRFGVFSARLDGQGLRKDRIEFVAAPQCQEIEGESLQDVTLRCNREVNSSTSACQALVLHRQGQRIATCPLPGEAPKTTPGTVSLAAAWLSEGSDMESAPQEEVSSIALAAGGCSGVAGECAFAQTTRQRIVELQAALNGGWFPTRVLQAFPTGAQDGLNGLSGRVLPGGALSLAGDRYLAVLRPNEKTIEALNPRMAIGAGGDDGLVMARWRLPGVSTWSAMCSAGRNLYLLEGGLAPQLWRFPLPAELQPKLLEPEHGQVAQPAQPAQAALPAATEPKQPSTDDSDQPLRFVPNVPEEKSAAADADAEDGIVKLVQESQKTQRGNTRGGRSSQKPLVPGSS